MITIKAENLGYREALRISNFINLAEDCSTFTDFVSFYDEVRITYNLQADEIYIFGIKNKIPCIRVTPEDLNICSAEDTTFMYE